MRIKQKLAKIKNKIKNKIKDNADEIVTVATFVGIAASVALVAYYKNELEKDRANHRECHDFAKWVVAKTQDGETRTIQYAADEGPDGMVHINNIEDTA